MVGVIMMMIMILSKVFKNFKNFQKLSKIVKKHQNGLILGIWGSTLHYEIRQSHKWGEQAKCASRASGMRGGAKQRGMQSKHWGKCWDEHRGKWSKQGAQWNQAYPQVSERVSRQVSGVSKQSRGVSRPSRVEHGWANNRANSVHWSKQVSNEWPFPTKLFSVSQIIAPFSVIIN